MRTSEAHRGAAIGLLAVALVLAARTFTPLFDPLERILHDAFSRRVAATLTPDPRIVIVSLNETSMRTLAPEYGSWPYSREVMALALGELRDAGAKVIAFDIQFPEAKLGFEDGDRQFAEALSSSPSVLAVQTERSRTRPLPSEVRSKLWRVTTDEPLPHFALIPPHAAFTGAAMLGTIRLNERTGASWRYALVENIAPNEFVPSLALATTHLFENIPAAGTIREGVSSFGRLRIPVDAEGRFAIRWKSGKKNAGAEGQIVYPVVNFDKVVLAALARSDPEAAGVSTETLRKFAQQFRGKIVLVALTAGGLFDLRETPISPIAPGVGIHAAALDNLINRDFSRDAKRSWVIFATFLGTALLGALLWPIRSQPLAASIAIGAVVGWVGTEYVMLANRTIFSSVAPAVAAALTYGVVTLSKFAAEQRKSHHLKATFGRYVSPQVLEHILENPNLVDLGGERRELTILFSDIRGFTSISEAAEPEDVVEMLNEYLTRMVEILLRHGGTLDKFIGDAVMGFWNAPTKDPDHARHAVLCGIEMVEETARLRERWISEGKTALRIGVGINTGEAVVGNIGSQQVFSYTVIGDPVNLASRLEGKNKDYNTEIIISEFTRSQIGEGIETLYLDEVKVKGKEKAVRIYQVKGYDA